MPSSRVVEDPFRFTVPPAEIDQLRTRLRQTRWPGVASLNWELGTDETFLKRLCEYWADGFDFTAAIDAINAVPGYLAEVDGVPLHYLHVPGNGPSPLPLILTHGWPSSYVEFLDVIGPLTDPARYGGDPADAFSVVVPSIPGFGHSGFRPGLNVASIAPLWNGLMTRVLGYESYVAQGGDWGGMITSRLGYSHAESVRAIHLNLVGLSPHPSRRTDLSDAELAWMSEMSAWQRTETGYLEIQSTKPQTLSYGLSDSPAGTAAWIVEKFRSWSDCQGDLYNVMTRDKLLTMLSVYWFTHTVETSVRIYAEERRNPWRTTPDTFVSVPTGVSHYPYEQVRPPREWAERVYNVQYWQEMQRGGHFPALEDPGPFVATLRDFFSRYR
ncbi:epoxide hydrolase [Nocardioides endophyticus]|uniref:Epoxide hydrolase n=1 Tax=Nocardioides endophyticus TaxID=1353775 RepID=A0ABP8YIE6_9ACTN